MEQFFNRAWQTQAGWLWLLLPFTWLYRFVTWLNKKLYDVGLKKIYYPPVPVIVIGNITVGGSGKTPLIIAFVEYLQHKNIQVGVISRGYGGNTRQMPTLVTLQSTPAQVGDEPCLIVQQTQVAMAVCPNRGQAIELLLTNFPKIQLILADDGLQHYALDRDKNWVVVDGDRGFGNGQVLPTGFLREPIRRLDEPDTTVIFHQQVWQNSLSKFNKTNLLLTLKEQPLQPLFPLTHSTNEINNDISNTTSHNINHLTPALSPQIIAMTGIGYPKRFFDSVKKLGFSPIEMSLNDHHDFSLADFDELPNLPIIITTKDAVKVRLLLQADNNEVVQHIKSRLWVLPVIASVSDEVWQTLDSQLVALGIVKA